MNQSRLIHSGRSISTSSPFYRGRTIGAYGIGEGATIIARSHRSGGGGSDGLGNSSGGMTVSIKCTATRKRTTLHLLVGRDETVASLHVRVWASIVRKFSHHGQSQTM